MCLFLHDIQLHKVHIHQKKLILPIILSESFSPFEQRLFEIEKYIYTSNIVSRYILKSHLC